MATTTTHRKLLSAGDVVTDALLHAVAPHVVYTHLRHVAYDVGVSEARVSQIVNDYPRQSAQQIFKVRETSCAGRVVRCDVAVLTSNV